MQDVIDALLARVERAGDVIVASAFLAESDDLGHEKRASA